MEANLLGAAATASKRLAVIAVMASERLAMTEVMSSKFIDCYVHRKAAQATATLLGSFR